MLNALFHRNPNKLCAHNCNVTHYDDGPSWAGDVRDASWASSASWARKPGGCVTACLAECLARCQEEDISNGLQASLLCAAISSPIVGILNFGFSWLRRPFVGDLNLKQGATLATMLETAGREKTGDGKEAKSGEGGEGGVADYAKATPATAAMGGETGQAAEQDLSRARDEVAAILSSHNPSKLPELDTLISRFGAPGLLLRVRGKYLGLGKAGEDVGSNSIDKEDGGRVGPQEGKAASTSDVPGGRSCCCCRCLLVRARHCLVVQWRDIKWGCVLLRERRWCCCCCCCRRGVGVAEWRGGNDVGWALSDRGLLAADEAEGKNAAAGEVFVPNSRARAGTRRQMVAAQMAVRPLPWHCFRFHLLFCARGSIPGRARRLVSLGVDCAFAPHTSTPPSPPSRAVQCLTCVATCAMCAHWPGLRDDGRRAVGQV